MAAGYAAASGLRFFLDRGLGAFVVPAALRAADWRLETMDERYGADQSQSIQAKRTMPSIITRGNGMRLGFVG